MNSEIQLKVQKDISLSDLTTIGLGGKAKYFMACNSINDIVSSLKFAEENNYRVQVMSGGSNIIFHDEGFDGIVMSINLMGVEFTEEENFIIADVKAGESWDNFVMTCIEKSLSGIECLSGIPGSAGATPIQNVGAYGQEVKDVIVSVTAIDRFTFEEVTFKNEDCDFDYRQSRFKSRDKDRYIITEIKFRFEKKIETQIKYPELNKLFELKKSGAKVNTLDERLMLIRTAVLELRKGKSMVIDKSDPNSKSCGSFFMNPLLNHRQFEKFKSETGMIEIPVYKSGFEYKISAAWLIEKAGFYKGYIKGGVGISQNHSLALININGTTKELIGLAEEIVNRVFDKFEIRLKREPEIVP